MGQIINMQAAGRDAGAAKEKDSSDVALPALKPEQFMTEYPPPRVVTS